MKVLILGASGYIGQRLVETLRRTQDMQIVCASRGPPTESSVESRRVDTRDLAALTAALTDCSAVVNCVAGDFNSIADGARTLASAARAANCRRVVHLSSMAVYGRAEGQIKEDSPVDPTAGWYARAKCEAETHLRSFLGSGGEVIILRPGCVYGPGSQLWVGRTGRWLLARRLGDLGVLGDGWSNLVHLDDVCAAIVLALQLPASQCRGNTFNLAAPDSPRWNDYFLDLAIAIGATPVRHISPLKLTLDSTVLGPPLKVMERLLDRLHHRRAWLPEPIPPSVRHLWPQCIRLDAHAAAQQLRLKLTSYETCTAQFPAWFEACRRSA